MDFNINASSLQLAVPALCKKQETVLENQISATTKDQFRYEPISRRVYSHLINSQMGIHGAEASGEYIQKCAERNVSWKDIESDWEQAFVVAIKLLRVNPKCPESWFPVAFSTLHYSFEPFWGESFGANGW